MLRVSLTPHTGRDLVGGGTWLGVSRSGRFATVTNILSPWDMVLAVATGKTVLASKATAVATAAAAAAAALLRSQPAAHDHGSSSSGWAVAAASASFALIRSSGPGPSLGLLWALCAAAGLATAASIGLSVAAATAKARISRGGLVADFLKGDEDAQTYCSRLSKASKHDGDGVWAGAGRDGWLRLVYWI